MALKIKYKYTILTPIILIESVQNTLYIQKARAVARASLVLRLTNFLLKD
jgi:hypothetical protein